MTLASYFQKEESECFASYDKNKNYYCKCFDHLGKQRREDVLHI